MTEAESPATAVRRLEHRFMEAVRDRDMRFLERHLAPEFILTTGRPGAETRGRAEWLAVTRDSYAIGSFSFESMDMIDLGDCVVVRSRYRQTARMGDEDRTAVYLMTDVWAARPEWQLVTRHITPLAA